MLLAVAVAVAVHNGRCQRGTRWQRWRKGSLLGALLRGAGLGWGDGYGGGDGGDGGDDDEEDNDSNYARGKGGGNGGKGYGKSLQLVALGKAAGRGDGNVDVLGQTDDDDDDAFVSAEKLEKIAKRAARKQQRPHGTSLDSQAAAAISAAAAAAVPSAAVPSAPRPTPTPAVNGVVDFGALALLPKPFARGGGGDVFKGIDFAA